MLLVCVDFLLSSYKSRPDKRGAVSFVSFRHHQ